MTNNANKNVLKGHHNLAKGSALGFKTGKEIVRAMMIFMEQSLFRTKRMSSYLSENRESKFRPKEVCRIDYLFPADGFVIYPYPWAEIYWPFRPKNSTKTEK